MPKFQLREVEWIASAVQRLVLWVEPAGGQTVARRNAWASLVEDHRRAAQQLEAAEAVRAALGDGSDRVPVGVHDVA